jgi:hypothetical protein
MSARPKPAAPAPAGYDPWAIVNDPTIDPASKRKRLCELASLVEQTQAATNEGMPTGRSPLPTLKQVLDALHELDGDDPPHGC